MTNELPTQPQFPPCPRCGRTDTGPTCGATEKVPTVIGIEEHTALLREARAEVWKEAHDACVPLMKSEFMALTFIKASEARKEGA